MPSGSHSCVSVIQLVSFKIVIPIHIGQILKWNQTSVSPCTSLKSFTRYKAGHWRKRLVNRISPSSHEDYSLLGKQNNQWRMVNSIMKQDMSLTPWRDS